MRPPRRRGLLLALGAVAIVVAFATLPAVAAESLFQVVAWTSLALFFTIGARRWRSGRRLWVAIGAGWACFAAGDLLVTVHTQVVDRAPFPSIADVFNLAGYPLVVLGLCGLVRQRQPGGDRRALVDAGLLASTVAVLGWVYLVQPTAGGPAIGTLTRFVSGASPVGDLLCLAVLVHLLVGRGTALRSMPRALVVLAATIATMLVADVAFLLDEVGRTSLPTRATEALELLTYLGLVGVALDRTMSNAGDRIPPEQPSLSSRRLVLLLGAALVTPAVVAVETMRHRSVSAVVIVIGTVAAVVLVAVRMSNLLRALAASRDALAHEVNHDPLTGIANRANFSRRLTDVLTAGRQCAVLLIDLDQFKAVNDELGHLVGDALLVETASRLAAAVRRGDLVARFAGDEFAVLLPDTDASSARTVTVRVAEALNTEVTVAGHRTMLRASVGLAHWTAASADRAVRATRGPASIDRLLAEADQAMYQAKRERARHLVLVPAAEEVKAPAAPAAVLATTAGRLS